MRNLGSLVLIVAAMLLAVLVNKVAGAEIEIECLESAAAVRQATPDARPLYSDTLAGKEGTRCWFAKQNWMRVTKAKTVIKVAAKRHRVRRLASAIPTPRANVKKQFEEFLSDRFRQDFNWFVLTNRPSRRERTEGE